MIWAVMYRDALETRKTSTGAMSVSASPILPSGMPVIAASNAASPSLLSVARKLSVIGVYATGESATTFIPYLPHSAASARVSEAMPPFDAA